MLRCQQEKMEKWRENNKRVMACTGGGSRCLSGREGMFFTPAMPGSAFRVPSGGKQKSGYPYGGRIRFSFSIYIPLRDASGNGGTLPRPKKQSTGLFFTPAVPGPAFRVPSGINQKKQMPLWGRVGSVSIYIPPGCIWKRRDSPDMPKSGHLCGWRIEESQHPFWGAVFLRWTLPRAKKVSTGHFLTFASLRPPFRVPSGINQKSRCPNGKEEIEESQHPFRGAVFLRWTLPRAKKVSTGHFLAFASLRPPFRVLSSDIPKNADARMAGEGEFSVSVYIPPGCIRERRDSPTA